MVNYKNISKQIGVSYFYKFMESIVSFLFFMVVTRALGVEDYGVFSLLLVTMTIISNSISLNIGSFLIKDLAGLKTLTKLNKLNGIVPLFNLASLLILGGLFYFQSLFLNLLGLTDYSSLFSLILIILLFKGIIKHFLTFLFSEKKIILAHTFAFFTAKGFMLVALLMSLYFSLNLSLIFMIYLVITLLTTVVLIVLFKNFTSFFHKPDFKYVKKASLFSLPLVGASIAQWVLTASDRYFIQYFHTVINVGKYAYIYSLLAFICLSSTLILEVLYPYIAEQYKKNKQKYYFLFNVAIKYSLIFVLPASLGIWALDKEIITMLSGAKYLSSLAVLPILIFFPLFQIFITLFTKVLILSNRTKHISKVYFIGMFVNLVLNYLLVPKYNYMGAAVATILTYVLLFTWLFLSSRNLFKWNHKFIQLKSIILSSLIMFFSITYLHPTTVLLKILTILLGVSIYVVSIILTKGVTKEEKLFIKGLFIKKVN